MPKAHLFNGLCVPPQRHPVQAARLLQRRRARHEVHHRSACARAGWEGLNEVIEERERWSLGAWSSGGQEVWGGGGRWREV